MRQATFCGLCWRGEGNVRMHYCDEQGGHEGPHRCHCGASLAKPTRLVPINSPSAFVSHSRAKSPDRQPSSVLELELSARSQNCLTMAGIKTVGELAQKTEAELLRIRGMGRQSVDEIKDVLAKQSLALKEEE